MLSAAEQEVEGAAEAVAAKVGGELTGGVRILAVRVVAAFAVVVSAQQIVDGHINVEVLHMHMHAYCTQCTVMHRTVDNVRVRYS